MNPNLDETFRNSTQWHDLSEPARAALEGLLQFAICRHGEWVVEGTPKQLGEWVAPETDLPVDKIVEGLRELDTAGCIKRGRCGWGNETRFVLRTPIVER